MASIYLRRHEGRVGHKGNSYWGTVLGTFHLAMFVPPNKSLVGVSGFKKEKTDQVCRHRPVILVPERLRQRIPNPRLA